MALKFKYKPRTAASVEKRAAGTSNFQGIIKDAYKTWRPANGDNFVRILPPTWEGADHFGFDVYSHYQVGPSRATVLCLARMKETKCPICEARIKAERMNEDEATINALRASRQVLVWMIDMKDKDKGPMIWAMAPTIDKELALSSKDRETGELYMIDNPETGYNVSFSRTGEGIQTKYSGFQLAKRATSVEDDWIEFIVGEPLPDCLVWRTYAEIKALFEGEEAEEEEEKPAAKKAKVKEPEPEDEEVEAEEEVKPKLKARPKMKEPEPEEEAEEVEEEEAPPTKAAKEEVSGKSRAEALRERFKR